MNLLLSIESNIIKFQLNNKVIEVYVYKNGELYIKGITITEEENLLLVEEINSNMKIKTHSIYLPS